MSGKKHVKWTPALDDVLRLLFPTYQSWHVAEIMGMSVGSVNSRAFILGIKKDAKYLAEIRLLSNMELYSTGKVYRFPKGHLPHNAGKTWSEEIKAKMRHTFYTKGHKPHNTQPVGHTRKNKLGYIDIKVSDGVFIGLHRYLWEQAHGPVPKGMAIIFADGDIANYDLENLVCVSRADLCLLNANKKYGKEIAESALYLSKIKKIISNKN